jgi:hypothetical protein
MKPFAALSAREKTIEVVRWLCVPVAIGATFAVVILLGQIAMPPQYAQPRGAPPPPAPVIPRVVTFRVLSVLMGMALVLAGAKTAPRHRLIVASVVGAMWLGHAFLYRIVVHLGQGTPHYFDFALAVAASAAAVALIYYSEKSTLISQFPTPDPRPPKS